ncbi:MAG: tripartite tricarboxylate transporter TctB family protein, partial [Betaproteobacteria bacterium]
RRWCSIAMARDESTAFIMKLDDTVWGALLLLLAVTIVVHVQGFPPMPGQRVGPALFPGLVASGVGVCALLLVYSGLRQRKTSGPTIAWVRFAPWTRSHRHVIAFLVVIAVNVFYIAAVDRLGFVLTGTVYLAALFAVFGVRGRWIVPLAILVTLVIHSMFYKLLRVPLPWGLLQGVAW